MGLAQSWLLLVKDTTKMPASTVPGPSKIKLKDGMPELPPAGCSSEGENRDRNRGP